MSTGSKQDSLVIREALSTLATPIPPNPLHFTRSQLRLFYKAAGVLPIALHAGEPWLLLGAEPSRTGPNGKVFKCMWKDFGGGREASDYDAAATAGREFAEETLGLFAGCGVDQDCVRLSAAAMSDQIRQHNRTLEVVHELRQGKYHMYVCQTPFIDPLMFDLATQQNQQSSAIDQAEKTKFCWVRLPDVLQAVAIEAQQYHMRIPYQQLAIKRPGYRHMQLHPCFARSMRLAQAQRLAALVLEMQNHPALPPCRTSMAACEKQAREVPALQVPAEGHLVVPVRLAAS